MASSDQEEQEIVDESQYIVEPWENDVLCGRGGMSNHHTGNEWYRRLIRSNRPLYRACPKHTKLLVAKAIVQAVEEQGGRFLERARKTGMWYQVSYKRAVDKTSQGLRERDKDGDGPKVTSLPASLLAKAGAKIPKPNLKDLAQVTMGYAGMTSTRTAKPTAATVPIVKQEPQQNNYNSMGGGGGVAPLDDLPPQPGFFSSESMFRMLSRLGGSGDANSKRPARNSFAQPTSNLGMPSMSGPGDSTFFGFGGGSNNNNQNDFHRRQQQRNSLAMQQQQQQQQQLQLQQQRFAEMQQTMSAGHRSNNNNSIEGAAPPLARLTTQVSDWLTSFWPVNKQDGASSAAVAAAAIAADGDTGVNSISNDLTGDDFALGNMQQNSMNPPMAMHSRQQQMMSQSLLSGTAAMAGGGSMPQGQLGAAQLSIAFGASNDNDVVAPPSALESSISTTLLKLASSPSKFFSGISTFFNSESSAAFGSHQLQQNSSGIPPPPPSLGVPVGRRSSRRSSDLLDDYEPDELEARLREVSGS